MVKKIFNITKNICKDNKYENKMACTVFKGGKIIGKGLNNNNRTSMCGCNHLPSIHAEVHSLMNACKNILKNNNNNITNNINFYNLRKRKSQILKGHSLMVVRLLKDGSITNSKPCILCTHFMKIMGIKKVYYIFNNNLICEKLNYFNNNIISKGLKNIIDYIPKNHFIYINYLKTINRKNKFKQKNNNL
jgi:tRNA(Arg) A34 adenosine deaminase TadA